MEKITVYHFNTYLQGGAAIAAQRLFDSLSVFEDLALKFYSTSYYNNKNYFHYNDVQSSSFLERIKNRVPFLESTKTKILNEFSKYLEGRPFGLEQFDPPCRYKTNIPKPLPDVIHLHWVSDFIDYESFFRQVPTHIPIVWTLHDMNPFTGGCHYTNGCDKFKTYCENCPQLGSYSKIDLAEYGFDVKKIAFARKNIHIVADSEWLKEEASCSALLKNASSIRCIHYGLDHTEFIPKDKESCRRVLNMKLDDDEFVLCFGADWVNNKRKGIHELSAAINLLAANGVKIVCLVFGEGEFENLGNIKIIQFGKITSVSFLTIIYNAADLFIMPSLEEAFGQTCLEAMACGVPVIAFNTGGIPDMVIDYETGLLAQKGNSNELADKIQMLLNDRNLRKQLSVNCRNKVVADFTLNKQASNYYNLYKHVLE